MSVRDYHERTKHAPHRFARSLGHLDWDTQPDPFRHYHGAPVAELEVVPTNGAPSYPQIYTGEIDPRPLTHLAISQLFFDSLALSAEKALRGNRWWLRVNPSSGNLHPTEGYVVLPAIERIADTPALHHYAPRAHALERLATLSDEEHTALTAGLGRDAMIFGFTSIHWREAWKYGERAYRYCQHDVGHAIAAVTFAAALLGWRTRMLRVADDDIATLLGVDRQLGIEREHPDVLLAIGPEVGNSVLEHVHGTSHGFAPNVLSKGHIHWDVIDDAAAAAHLAEAPSFEPWQRPALQVPVHEDAPDARHVIRTRRSAVAMDARSGITRDAFYEMLLRVSPGEGHRPFDVLPWKPRVHLALFVHRVADLSPGLYVLLRRDDRTEQWRGLLPEENEWVRPEDCPDGLELYRLQEADARQAAAGISCGQDIAGDGAFAVAMIAELDDALTHYGPWFYRHLHWEAGAIGQVLYLEAEAAGIRATGIGCFFDDLTHDILGLTNTGLATIYHFTVGGPVHDDRIQTTDPYAGR